MLDGSGRLDDVRVCSLLRSLDKSLGCGVALRIQSCQPEGSVEFSRVSACNPMRK